MPSLADIAPIHEIIEVRGVKFPITGLSAEHIARLLDQFPPLRNLLTDRATDPAQWVKQLPEIVPLVIAAGCGKMDDPKEIEAARRMGLDDQLAFFGPIWKKTLPDGIAGFFDRLTTLAGVPTPKTPAISAPAAPSRARVTKSRSRSKR